MDGTFDIGILGKEQPCACVRKVLSDNALLVESYAALSNTSMFAAVPHEPYVGSLKAPLQINATCGVACLARVVGENSSPLGTTAHSEQNLGSLGSTAPS